MSTPQAIPPPHDRPVKKRKDLPLPELSALTEAGLAIVRAQLDLDGLCELVYQQVMHLVDANSFHLGLFEGDSFRLKVWVQDGQRRALAAFPGGQAGGIVGWVRSTQQPLLVRDFLAEMDQLPAQPSYEAENPPRAALFVPLVAGGLAVGSMSVQHMQPDVYDAEDLQLLSIIAHLAASAIVNAQLFQTVGRRVEQLATIAEVSSAIAAELDLDELLAKVVELIRERFDYYHVQVFLVEDDEHRAVFRASTGYDLNKLWTAQGRSLPFGAGIIGWVAATGEHLLANDVSQEPRYLPDDPRLLPDTRSELAVPLKVEDKVLGVLDVQSRDLDGFSDDDLFVLDALANQVAVAVDSAWSYRAQQEEAWMSTVLLQVAHVASRANTLDDVLAALTRLVPMLTGVASCGIWLYDDENELFELAASFGLLGDEPDSGQLRMRPEADPVPALMLLKDTLEPVELTPQDDFMLPSFLWQILPGDFLILLPLLAQNRLIGCLLVSLDSEEMPIRLHEKRLSMLSGVANQAAAAIENVRLGSAREQEAWISWALLEMSQAMANARTVDDMLEQVVRLTPLLAGVDRCAALLRDPQGDEFRVARTYMGQRDLVTNLVGVRLRAGDLPLLDLAVRTRRLQRVDDASQSDMVPPAWREGVANKTLVAAPLLVQGEVRGVLLVDSTEAFHSMSQRREAILNGIAQQLSLNLENFQLLAQEQDRIRLAQELQVAQRIQASLLPAVTPAVEGYEIAHAWDPAREVGGDFYDFLPLPHGKLGLLMADVADKGIPAALFMATTSTLLRVSAHDHAAPDQALLHANTWINAGNREDMFVTAWYGILDPASHRVDFANAGHSLALHVQAVDGVIRMLRPAGMPLGVVEDLVLERDAITLAPGDMIVLYTDGVIDALNEAQEDFGQDRLEALLFGRRHQPAQEVIAALRQAVLAHAGQAPLFDDVTLVALRRLG
ncbi:MAG TPA: GAF domain-containing protein [Anaerolineae bacterium]|nr:GAF domain-containing protein [Anaerolineae bacterium]